VSAVVVTSASMREMAVFIGSISVLDTIGTLRLSHIEIVTLFRLASCCVGLFFTGSFATTARAADTEIESRQIIPARVLHRSGRRRFS
jgi:hypothetical protein